MKHIKLWNCNFSMLLIKILFVGVIYLFFSNFLGRLGSIFVLLGRLFITLLVCMLT